MDLGAVTVVIAAGGRRLRTADCGPTASGSSRSPVGASRLFVSAVRSPQPASRPLHDHRVPHPPGRANREQPELPIAANELVAERREDAAAGGAEGVADGDGAAEDVEPVGIDLTDRLREARAL